MVGIRRPDAGRARDCVAGDWLDVRAGHLAATRSRGAQHHGCATGRPAEVLIRNGKSGILTMLPWTIYSSFIGATVLLLLPRDNPRAARIVALLTALGGLAIALAGTWQAGAGMNTFCDAQWVPALGIRYHLAADGISLTLVVLTGLAAVAGILFSWNIEHRAKEFFAFYLALIGGVYGVFLSADAFLLFVFYEIAIVPKYFLIANWGSTNREYGAMKLVLYSFAGSALVLAGLLWAYACGGSHSFAVGDLACAATH